MVDKEWHKAAWERKKARMAADPDYAAKIQEQRRRACLKYYHAKRAELSEEELKRRAERKHEQQIANLRNARQRQSEQAAQRRAEQQRQAEQKSLAEARESMKRKPGRLLMRAGWRRADDFR